MLTLGTSKLPFAVLKRNLSIIFGTVLFFCATADARFVPRWHARLSGGYSYWKLNDLNQRILNRKPFFDAAGESSYSFKGLPSGHLSFNLGLQYDILPKISLLGSLEYRPTTRTNEATNDTIRVQAVTRPRQINFGLDGLWRLAPGGNLLIGGGGGISFARFTDDVRTYRRQPGSPDSLSGYLSEKYSSTAIFAELRAVYILPFTLFRDQRFFVEALGRLNPIEAFTGTKNQNGQVANSADATFFPPGSSTAVPVKLDFSGFYLGFGADFRL